MSENSRNISKVFKRLDSGTMLSIQANDHLNPNTFEMMKTGRIQSTPYGRFSNITLETKSFVKGSKVVSISYAIHPDRLAIVLKKYVNKDFDFFIEKSNVQGFEDRTGFVHKSIFTSKPKNGKFEASVLNIYMKEKFIIFKTEIGIASYNKDEYNKNDFVDFVKEQSIQINVPFDDMDLFAEQILNYLNDFRQMALPIMLDGRTVYEQKCRTIFKDVIGNAQLIREIEEKFSKLSKEEKILAEQGKLKL